MGHSITIFSRLMPLRAACSVRSFLLLEEILKTDTGEPSSLNVPRECTHPAPQASSKVCPMVYGNAGLLLTRAVSLANILLFDYKQMFCMRPEAGRGRIYSTTQHGCWDRALKRLNFAIVQMVQQLEGESFLHEPSHACGLCGRGQAGPGQIRPDF